MENATLSVGGQRTLEGIESALARLLCATRRLATDGLVLSLHPEEPPQAASRRAKDERARARDAAPCPPVPHPAHGIPACAPRMPVMSRSLGKSTFRLRLAHSLDGSRDAARRPGSEGPRREDRARTATGEDEGAGRRHEPRRGGAVRARGGRAAARLCRSPKRRLGQGPAHRRRSRCDRAAARCRRARRGTTGRLGAR